jgi:hypothetical protein
MLLVSDRENNEGFVWVQTCLDVLAESVVVVVVVLVEE